MEVAITVPYQPEANVGLTRKVGSTPDLSPKQKRKVQVQIVNPLPGGSPVMSLYHAERYTRRGDAQFDGDGRLVFRIRAASTLISAEQQLQINSRMGYDCDVRDNLATRLQMAGIPIVNPDVLLRK